MKTTLTKDVVDEVAQFQGAWKQTAWSIDGVSHAADEFGMGAITVFAGQTYVVTQADGKVVIKGTFAIDPSRKPKTVDWTDTFGADAGKTFPGIYSLENDRLIFCVGDEGQRPTEFRAHPTQVLRILHRELHREKA